MIKQETIDMVESLVISNVVAGRYTTIFIKLNNIGRTRQSLRSIYNTLYNSFSGYRVELQHNRGAIIIRKDKRVVQVRIAPEMVEFYRGLENWIMFTTEKVQDQSFCYGPVLVAPDILAYYEWRSMPENEQNATSTQRPIQRLYSRLKNLFVQWWGK